MTTIPGPADYARFLLEVGKIPYDFIADHLSDVAEILNTVGFRAERCLEPASHISPQKAYVYLICDPLSQCLSSYSSTKDISANTRRVMPLGFNVPGLGTSKLLQEFSNILQAIPFCVISITDKNKDLCTQLVRNGYAQQSRGISLERNNLSSLSDIVHPNALLAIGRPHIVPTMRTAIEFDDLIQEIKGDETVRCVLCDSLVMFGIKCSNPTCTAVAHASCVGLLVANRSYDGCIACKAVYTDDQLAFISEKLAS